jgi:hypothetical protein
MMPVIMLSQDLLRRQPREDAAPACFPEPKRRKTTGEDRAKASKDVPKTPKAKTLFSKITKSLMRLRIQLGLGLGWVAWKHGLDHGSN